MKKGMMARLKVTQIFFQKSRVRPNLPIRTTAASVLKQTYGEIASCYGQGFEWRKP